MLMLVNGDHHLTQIVWTNAPKLLVVQGGGLFGGGLCQSCGFFSEVHRLTPQLAEPGQLPERTGARHSSPASIVRKLTGPATGIFGLDRSQSGKLGCRLPGNFLCCCKKPPAGTRIYGPLFLTPRLASAASKHGRIPRLQISFTL
jgi:hypothetical protein